MDFKMMNIENVHIETACNEIRKNFKEKWVREDDLIELFYLILKIKKTENKRSERHLIKYLERRRLLEIHRYRHKNLGSKEAYKLTEKFLDLLQ